MIDIDERTWKAVCQELGSLKQVNSVEGNDGIRSYFDGDTLVAQMRVIDSETDKPGQHCRRVFAASRELVAKAEQHYIPTNSEWDEWDDFRGHEDDEAWLIDKGVRL